MTTMLSEVTMPHEHSSVLQAQEAANAEAAATGGRVYPCVVFQQGQRLMVATSFPLAFVARQVKPQAAAKGGTKGLSAKEATNRPLMADHARSIKDYLVTNEDHYILPPVTLNVRVLPSLHVQAGNVPTRTGYMVIHDNTYFWVTDGQHRIAGLAGYPAGRGNAPGALEECPGLNNDGLAVLIVYERELSRVHQDFADAAQTKQIPPSLLAVYNTREPINRVLTKLVEQSRLLNDRVDETSKSLPKMSQHIFLLNQVRGLIKELLVSDFAMAEDSLTRHAAKQIGTQEQQDEFIRTSLQLVDTLTDHMEPWKTIAELPSSGGAANQIPDFRAAYVNMTATGLAIIGRIAYEINKNPDEEVRKAGYIDLATKIDWQRSAPIWLNNIVSADGKLSNQRGPVAAAANAVRQALNI
jgi:DNA sulfur modification protein DndB